MTSRANNERRDEAAVLRHEEELEIGKELEQVAAAHARKHVETDAVEEVVPRQIEHAEVERVPADDGDSGEVETLPDGSISIPVLEEELVVTKRTVVRERIVIRKRTVTERERIEAELRREKVDVQVEQDEGTDTAR